MSAWHNTAIEIDFHHIKTCDAVSIATTTEEALLLPGHACAKSAECGFRDLWSLSAPQKISKYFPVRPHRNPRVLCGTQVYVSLSEEARLSLKLCRNVEEHKLVRWIVPLCILPVNCCAQFPQTLR